MWSSEKTRHFFTYFFDLPIFIWTSKTFRRGSIFWKLAQQYIQGAGKDAPPPPHNFWPWKQGFFNKRTIKVCVSCFRQCPETSEPNSAYLTVFLVSLELQEQCARRVERPRRASCQLKKPLKVLRPRRGRSRREYVFPNGWSLICPPGNSMVSSCLSAVPLIFDWFRPPWIYLDFSEAISAILRANTTLLSKF